jgi:hypothetical protein
MVQEEVHRHLQSVVERKSMTLRVKQATRRGRAQNLRGSLHVVIDHLYGDGVTLMIPKMIAHRVMAATLELEEGRHIEDLRERGLQDMMDPILPCASAENGKEKGCLGKKINARRNNDFRSQSNRSRSDSDEIQATTDDGFRSRTVTDHNLRKGARILRSSIREGTITLCQRAVAAHKL